MKENLGSKINMKIKGTMNLTNCKSLVSLGNLKSVGSIYNAPDFIKEKYKGKFEFVN